VLWVSHGKIKTFKLLVALLSLRRPGFFPSSVYVEFVVGKLALRQETGVSPSTSFPLSVSFHQHYIILPTTITT